MEDPRFIIALLFINVLYLHWTVHNLEKRIEVLEERE